MLSEQQNWAQARRCRTIKPKPPKAIPKSAIDEPASGVDTGIWLNTGIWLKAPSSSTLSIRHVPVELSD